MVEVSAVTEGSFKHYHGTAAWSITCHRSKQQLSGQIVVPGDATDHSSYRSELAGINTALLVTHKLCQFFRIESGGIILGCDSTSALATAFVDYDHRYSINTPSFDFLGAIRQLQRSSLIEWRTNHIKGHQDQRVPLQELTDLEKLNIAMDLQAKNHFPYAYSQPRHYAIYLEPWSIWYKDKKISNNIHSTVYNIVHSPTAYTYWSQKKRISNATIQSVHWDALGQAAKEITLARHTFVIKASVGMCGVGKFLKRWKQSSSSACPRCLAPVEDINHVWKCQHPDVKALWTTTLIKLSSWLEDQYTDPALKDGFLLYLDSWRSDLPLPPAPLEFTGLFQSQTAIGWNLLEGWLSASWADIQQEYLSSIRSRRSGRRWLIALIKKLWDVSWDLWDHRNGIVHRSAQQLQSADLIQLDCCVTHAYQDLLQCTSSRAKRHLTFLPLRNILAKDVRYKTVWLRQAITVVNQSHLGACQSLLQMRRCLEAWL
jgi:hypothetical protein